MTPEVILSEAEISQETATNGKDFLPLKAIDHIELYVGNAKQSAYYYRAAFGFSIVAYAGLETGVRDRTSYVLQQGKIRLVLTTPLIPEHPAQDHLRKHGDGVIAIALEVDDPEYSYEETTKRGAQGALQPTEIKDANGIFRASAIKAYGDTLHVFINRKDYKGFGPGYRDVPQPDPIARPCGGCSSSSSQTPTGARTRR